MMECEHLTETSGENGWCSLNEGTVPESMCQHCQGDVTGLFRMGLEAGKAKRDLRKRIGAGGETFSCHRFGGVKVDAEFCEVCHRNAALKQKLSGQRGAVSRVVNPCVHRGQWLRTKEEPCCGGKTRKVDVHNCAKGWEATTLGCLKCSEYETGKKKPSAGAGCRAWPELWKIHEGKTILILACGPSVLLPGTDLDEDTIDPCKVERDVVLSTNWAWKWYGDIIDYQVSYDVVPCLGWRPAHVKLLTPTRKKETMRILERCHPYCLFPTRKTSGELAQGKPLPCSRNSGFTAIAMAAYMGASRILVLGMDFCGSANWMHFYPESDFDVRRRASSYSSQKERVQTDLASLLKQVRGMGVEVENLSPISGLNWG